MFLISRVFDASLLMTNRVSVPESPGTYEARSACPVMVVWAWADCPSDMIAMIASVAAIARFAFFMFMNPRLEEVGISLVLPPTHPWSIRELPAGKLHTC